MCSQVLLDGDEIILVVRVGNSEVLVFFVTQEGQFYITRTRVCSAYYTLCTPYYRKLTLHEINANFKIRLNLSRVNLC